MRGETLESLHRASLGAIAEAVVTNIKGAAVTDEQVAESMPEVGYLSFNNSWNGSFARAARRIAAVRLAYSPEDLRSPTRSRELWFTHKGRSKGGGPFLMIDHYVFECPAFRALQVGPRALLLELIRKFNGSNNGQIGFGTREAGPRLNVGKDTVNNYFHALEDAGFIVRQHPGGFNMKDKAARRASEWRLTWHPSAGQLATKEFMKKSTVQKIRTSGIDNLDRSVKSDDDCPDI